MTLAVDCSTINWLNGGGKDKCKEPKQVGKCGEKLARWAFSSSDNKCMPFYYTGCEGNTNNYRTEEECQTSCPEEKGVLIVNLNVLYR